MFVILGIGIIAGHFWHKSKRYAYTDDREACHVLLSEDSPRRYSTLPLGSHDAFSQDREIRRMVRREQLRDNIEGVHRISVRMMEDDEVSLSSDGLSLGSEERIVAALKEREDEEDEEDSSESNDTSSGNSDDSEDSDEVVEVRELMAMRRPNLPKSVSQLMATRN
jgi:hypothetical protein